MDSKQTAGHIHHHGLFGRCHQDLPLQTNRGHRTLRLIVVNSNSVLLFRIVSIVQSAVFSAHNFAPTDQKVRRIHSIYISEHLFQDLVPHNSRVRRLLSSFLLHFLCEVPFVYTAH